LLFHIESPLFVVQLYAEPDVRRYLETKKEEDGRFVTKNSGSLSVAGLFAGLKERLQLLCGWDRETVAKFFWQNGRSAHGHYRAVVKALSGVQALLRSKTVTSSRGGPR